MRARRSAAVIEPFGLPAVEAHEAAVEVQVAEPFASGLKLDFAAAAHDSFSFAARKFSIMIQFRNVACSSPRLRSSRALAVCHFLLLTSFLISRSTRPAMVDGSSASNSQHFGVPNSLMYAP